jgi:hypothetical protein
MRRTAAAVIATIGLLAMAAPAQGQSIRYVDEDAGAGGAACSDPNDPCDQISDATAVAGAGSTIFVGADVYSESVTLNSGVSLVASNFNPAFTADNGGVTAIDGGAGNGILVAPGAIAREIRGFTIEGDADAIELQTGAAATTVSIVGNTFPSRDTQFDSRIQASNNTVSTNVTIEGNAWTWGAAVDTNLPRSGVVDDTTGPLNAVVRNNSFDAVSSPLVFSGNDPEITGNTMTRVYEDIGGTVKRAIDLTDSSATVEGNTIVADATSGLGIVVDNSGAIIDAPKLHRNAVTGFDSDALNVRGNGGTADTVTVGDSLFTHTGAGFAVNGTDLRAPGSLSLTGVTLDDPSGSVLYVDGTRLTLDSSILSGGISSFNASTCTSTFSRSPTTGTPGDLTNCDDFATTAAPGFVGSGDFRLAAGSAMIDAGNPAGAGPLDLAGNPRALLGTPACSQTAGVRDIGAYEFVGATGVGCPIAAPAPVVKKCKKAKKKKGTKRKKKRCGKKKKKKKRR